MDERDYIITAEWTVLEFCEDYYVQEVFYYSFVHLLKDFSFVHLRSLSKRSCLSTFFVVVFSIDI